MEDLFKREQDIFDDASRHLAEVESGAPCSGAHFESLVKEYGKLLRQLRRVTKLSDKTTVDLNTSKLDLLDKVHYDALTGIYNRRFMEDRLGAVIKSVSRAGGMLSVMMIDVDFFKLYNDNYGHSMGDSCLTSVALSLKNSLTRADDFVARYGGEEFAVVLPNTDKNGARTIAERMLGNIRALGIPHEKSSVASHVTISVGVVTGPARHELGNDDYLKQADKALYIAKQNGRNRYTIAVLGEDV